MHRTAGAVGEGIATVAAREAVRGNCLTRFLMQGGRHGLSLSRADPFQLPGELRAL
ncbi:MAG: hypothetical protein ACI9OD_004489, partial [Limisphaerales bacterium]